MGQTLSEPVVEKVRFVPQFFPALSLWLFTLHLAMSIGTGTLAREGHCLLSHEPLTQRWPRLGIPRNIRPNLPAARASITSLVGCMEELPDRPDFIFVL